MDTKAPKSSNKATILYGENDNSILESQTAIFEQAGYSVCKAIGRKAIEQAVARQGFDIVVLGHTLTRDDRHHLPYMAKKGHEDTRILVLHASGRHPQVDKSMDSREGPRAILEAVADLVGEKLAQPKPSMARAHAAGAR
ncbi:MAG TPA: hypothetical protein VFZ99_02320 [Terriglobales bacterium]